jgi:hypothetical protein
MKITIFKNLSFSILICLIMMSCGNTDDSITVEVEPSEKLVKKLANKDYSIVLNDMNIVENSGIKKYQHKYNLLQVERDSLVVDSLKWQTVNRSFFEKHENDLGMEIISHHDGKLSRIAQPVGFGWAIGNEKYGSWEEVKKDSTATTNTTTTGSSSQRQWRSNGTGFFFWYWMMRRPAYQSNYNGYRTASANNQPYYGTTADGSKQYGTRSIYEKTKRPSFFSRKKTSPAWSSHTTEKTKRSTSRYKSSSSTRSRSGGFGK